MGNYLYAVIPCKAEVHVHPEDAEVGIVCEYGPDLPELRDCDSEFTGQDCLYLYPGFLLINTCLRMYILEAECEPNHFRFEVFKVVKALGASEAWYISEYCLDELDSDPDISYEKLLKKIREENKPYTMEYAKGLTEVSSYVHDSFSDFLG